MSKIDYITAVQAAEQLSVSKSRIIALCRQGRINGVIKFGNSLAIPKNFTVSEGTRGPKFEKINQD